jgi:hypothetical protein
MALSHHRNTVISNPRSRALVAAAAYLLLALAWSWPLPLHLSNRFTHDPGDPLLVTYLLWWNAQALPLTRAWWNAPFFWPMTDALALTEHLAGLSPVSTPIQLLGGSPLLAYNVILICSTWWSGLATHALVRRLTSSQVAAYCSGIAFALAPYRTSQLAHLQIYASWWLPVTLWALHGYYDDRRPRWLALFGLAWLMQTLTYGYSVFFLPLLLIPWVAWFTPWRTDAKRSLPVLATWILFSIPLIPVLLEYHRVQAHLGLVRTRDQMIFYSANLSAFLSAAPQLWLWPKVQRMTTETYLFPGLTVIVLIVVAAAAGLRRGAFAFYILGALMAAWLCLGPTAEGFSLASLWHPYDWIVWLPGFNGIRVPPRFFLVSALCLAVAAGLALAHLETVMRSGRRIVAAMVFAGLIVDGAIPGMQLGVPPGNFASMKADGRVIALPFDDAYVHIHAMYRSIAHRMPVVNGYAGYIPPMADVIQWALRRRDPSILMQLRRGRPLYVVVASGPEAETWNRFMDAQNDAQLLGVSGSGRVYRMPPAAFPKQVTVGPALSSASVESRDGWLVADLGQPQTVRALEIRTNGDLVRLPAMIRIETSPDGSAWSLAVEEAPGALALVGALAQPRAIPLRLILPDVRTRHVRINAGRFRTSAVTIFGP